MLKAKDIMTADTVSVKEDTPIREALKLFVDHDISGMPVVEDDGTLVGIVSEKDVISLFYEKQKGQGKMVSDFMTRPAIYFDVEDNLEAVCDFLVKNIFRRVPITSEGKLVGIISVRDVLKTLL